MGIYVDIPDGWVDYTPKAMGNREDPDPTTVEIQPMNAAELREFQRRFGPAMRGKNADQHAVKLVRKLLCDRVRAVRNCYFQGEITTGDELAERGPSALIDDVFTAIVDLSHLQEGLRKKSESPSDS